MVQPWGPISFTGDFGPKRMVTSTPPKNPKRNDLGVGGWVFWRFFCSKIMRSNEKTQEVLLDQKNPGLHVSKLREICFLLEIVLTDLHGISRTPFFCPLPIQNPLEKVMGRLWEGGVPPIQGSFGREIISQRNAAMNSTFPLPGFLFRSLPLFFCFNAIATLRGGKFLCLQTMGALEFEFICIQSHPFRIPKYL